MHGSGKYIISAGMSLTSMCHEDWVADILGLEQVVLGCYRDNIGSIKTILKNKGRFVRECEGVY